MTALTTKRKRPKRKLKRRKRSEAPAPPARVGRRIVLEARKRSEVEADVAADLEGGAAAEIGGGKRVILAASRDEDVRTVEVAAAAGGDRMPDRGSGATVAWLLTAYRLNAGEKTRRMKRAKSVTSQRATHEFAATAISGPLLQASEQKLTVKEEKLGVWQLSWQPTRKEDLLASWPRMTPMVRARNLHGWTPEMRRRLHPRRGTMRGMASPRKMMRRKTKNWTT
mmetsp:Transcript_76657/g.169398  ORF Transcript_76657/g.169398 Transcript_76657/m.169398 type:complete len:225 (-) Transcript_76657:1133-1807(-)